MQQHSTVLCQQNAAHTGNDVGGLAAQSRKCAVPSGVMCVNLKPNLTVTLGYLSAAVICGPPGQRRAAGHQGTRHVNTTTSSPQARRASTPAKECMQTSSRAERTVAAPGETRLSQKRKVARHSGYNTWLRSCWIGGC